MRWPLIRRRTYQREYVALSQAYQQEIADARLGRRKAEERLQRWVDSLAPRIDTMRVFTPGGTVLKILVEVDERMMRSQPQHELLIRVRDSIMRRLVDLEKDYRGDMRDARTPTQRMLDHY